MDASIKISYEVFDNAGELPADEANLLARAETAAEGAYAPFSEFNVGCAIELKEGEIMTGNNQENLAYPSGLCAERVTLFFANASGKGKDIRKIAVRAFSKNVDVNVPVTPCGACRQVMLEYERMAGRPFIVLMQGAKGKILRVSGVENSLLPFGFNIDFK